MPPKYSSESDETASDNAESSDNFHVVPSVDDDDEEERDSQLSNDEQDHSSDGETSEQSQVGAAVQVEVEEAAQQPPPHPILVFLLKATKTILLPLCKIIFAPAAQKTFVKTTTMMLTISSIITTSMIAYIVFYNAYIPPITHVQPIWFHFEQNFGPKAIVNIASGNSVPLRHEQVYDVSVQLHVPTSDTNFDIGNFMIDLELQTNNGSTITTSSRPAILRYQSRTQRIMRVFAKALPLLVGLSEESQLLTIKLIDNFTELKNQAVNRVHVSISDSRIQIYDAQLLILANFHGLRYYMYFNRITTAVVFMVLFATIEFMCATIAWKGFGEKLWYKLHETFIQEQQQQPEQQQLVVGADDVDSVGDISATSSEVNLTDQ